MEITTKRIFFKTWQRLGNAFRLIITSSLSVFGAFLAIRLLPVLYATIIAVTMACVCSALCLRGLQSRLGPQHRISRLATRLFSLLKVRPYAS